jgi:patatin-like phospholipase/acyl hydrolase
MSETIKILSIDGGGIRGIIPAMILDHIEKTTGKAIYQLFDLIAGTSTGGILALGLTKPGDPGKAQYSAADLINFYMDQGPKIFSESILQKIEKLGGVMEEKYYADTIEKILKETFGMVKLSEVLTDVVIPSYNIETRDCYFFKRWEAKQNPAVKDFLLWQVARATSAAPTYFPPSRIDRGGSLPYLPLVDGGVFANNPTACAFAEARRIYEKATEFLVVSLGTGQLTRPIPYAKAKDWGLLGWAPHILDVVFDGMLDVVDYQMKWLLPQTHPKQYYRFQTELDKAYDEMDNASEENLNYLKEEAEDILNTYQADLQNLCRQLWP